MFEITDQPLTAESVADAVCSPDCGAVVTFLGTVRSPSHGRDVSYLEYEAYPEMAVRKMEQIAAEIHERWRISHVAMRHRTGRLAVGGLGGGDPAGLRLLAFAHRAEPPVPQQLLADPQEQHEVDDAPERQVLAQGVGTARLSRAGGLRPRGQDERGSQNAQNPVHGLCFERRPAGRLPLRDTAPAPNNSYAADGVLSLGGPHTGGVNLVYVDGSVHAVEWEVDPLVWNSLADREDGETHQ